MAALAVAAGALVAVLSQSPAPGALLLASGDPMPEQIETRTTLSDGSTIEPDGSSYRVLVNRNDALTGLVAEGTTRFEVTPGGPRRWTIECGLAQVEVVGTVFEIERSHDAVRVSVERGTVLVRSVHLTDGVRRVEAGESVRIERPHDEPIAPVEAPVELEPEPNNPSVEVAPEPPPETFASLLERADRARAAGESDDAERILLDALARHPHHRDRALAWFTVGRIRLAARRHADALAAIEGALDRGLPEALREEAWIRRIECLVALGQDAAARQAAVEHGALYPSSHRRAQVESLLR